MRLRPLISTRTDTLFPYTTLCRSSQAEVGAAAYLPAALNDGQSLTLLRLLGFGPSVAARCRMIESLLGARGAVIALDGDADATCWAALRTVAALAGDRKSTRLNSSH